MKKILYIEDVNIVYKRTTEILSSMLVQNKIEVIQAGCIEMAYFYLMKGDINGVIVDLQIGYCNAEQRANIPYYPVNDLKKYDPLFGIGILLHLQLYRPELMNIPKLILTETHFDVFDELYMQLSTPKSYIAKDINSLDVNCRNISNWIFKNGLNNA